MALSEKDSLLAKVEGLLNSGEYSDMTVTCGEVTYKVHKTIVCSQVPFFAGAVRFKTGQEADSIDVDLSNDDPSAVASLIDYLYKADYSPCIERKEAQKHTCDSSRGRKHTACLHHRCSLSTCNYTCVDWVCDVCSPAGSIHDADPDDLQLHIKVYQLADMYQVDGLKKLAKDKLALSCRSFWDTDQFVSVARLATEVDKALGLVISRTLAFHSTLLKKPEIALLLDEKAGLAPHILQLRADDLALIDEIKERMGK